MTCYTVVICCYMLLYSSLRTLNNSSGIQGHHHSQVASPSLGALAFSDRISGVLLARGLRCPAVCLPGWALYLSGRLPLVPCIILLPPCLLVGVGLGLA